MGRIKTTLIKRKTQELLKLRVEEFSIDFDQNKKAMDKNAEIKSKKFRNIMAGYMSRLKRKQQ